MNAAIIDLGSNSARLFVYEYRDKTIKCILKQKEMIGLASYIREGSMEEEGINQASKAISIFKKAALNIVEEQYIYAFATAALRNIANSDHAATAISETTGQRIQILSGEEEAELGLLGALQRTQEENGIFVDIGGGSTEIILFKNCKPLHATSLPVGCLNLYSQYVESAMPSKSERIQIREVITEQLNTISWKEEQPLLLGIGGTLRAARKLTRTLFDVYEKGGYFPSEHINDLLFLLNHERSHIFQVVNQVVPERVLTIIPGLMILKSVVDFFGSKRIQVSKSSIADGYLVKNVLHRL